MFSPTVGSCIGFVIYLKHLIGVSLDAKNFLVHIFLEVSLPIGRVTVEVCDNVHNKLQGILRILSLKIILV